MSAPKKPECVMVVAEDNLVAQDIALRIAKLGYGIAGMMRSGAEALEKIDRLKPDLILMDLMLADSMAGMEAIRKIRLAGNIPVIFLGSYTEHEWLPTAPSTCLKFPLNERELELKLELALLQQQMEEQTRLTVQTLERRILEITHELDASHQAMQELHSRQYRDHLSQHRFSDALDDSADSIYLIDRINMRFIDVNKTACERLGYSRSELLEMGPHDIKPYFSRQTMEHVFDRIAATQNRFGIIDTYHQCKNNEIYPVEVRLRASEAEERPIIVAIARDMTVRQQNEQALRLSEEKFRRLFECSPIGLVLMTHDYRITDVNPAICNMLGYQRDEWIGKTMLDITHPDEKNASLEIAENLFSDTATNHIFEKKYLHKNGDPVWGRMHGTVIRDHNQQPLFGLGMIENIDHIKRAESLRLAHESAQKKALVREVHHRIKNHLQGVVGLMQQHAQNNSDSNDTIALAIAQINAVATVHGLQGKTASEGIDLLQMLTAISQSLRQTNPARFASAIRVTGKQAPRLDRDESVPVALALNELMVNAAKHGNAPMEISLYCNTDHAIIHIENSCVQTAAELTRGSGLELVQALLQMKGAMFRYQRTDQRFLAEIELTPPVIGVYSEVQAPLTVR